MFGKSMRGDALAFEPEEFQSAAKPDSDLVVGVLHNVVLCKADVIGINSERILSKMDVRFGDLKDFFFGQSPARA
jgi:hypothetical protein